jgi:ubiquinone/menaquinone biosynthesis C-methylase UbiE
LVADELASIIHLNQGRILDLCCGVGMSTRALQDAFPNAEQIIGVDTSSEMIAMAKAIDIQDTIFKPFTSFAKTALNKLDSSLQRQYNAMHHKSMKITKAASNKIVQACSHISFATQNAEHTTFESNSFDLITIM